MGDARKEQLIRQYEDAALALTQEEQAQGDTHSPNACPKSRKRGLLLRIFRACAMAAVVALALLGLVTATVLSVDALRVPVLNFILDHGGKFAFVNVGFNDAGLEKQFKAIVKTVEANAPEGYAIANEPATDDPMLLIRMVNSKEDILHVCAHRESASIKVDTEGAQIQKVELKGGQKGYLIIEEGLYCIWHDEAKGLIISVSTMNVEPDDFWKLVNALAK